VGPVLQATPFAQAVVEAIRRDNDDVTVRDEGAYLRVQVAQVCRLSRAAVEEALGADVRFPGDLEMVMSSFTGLVRLTSEDAVWWRPGGQPPGLPEGR